VWVVALVAGLTSLLVLGLAVWTAWGLATLRYEVTPGGVLVTYGPSRVEIGRDEITRLYLLERPTGGRRIAGSSLPGLKQGLWAFNETGRISLYATTTADLVVIETADRTWGLSPADPRAFLEAAGTASGGPTRAFAPARPKEGGGAAWVAVLFGVALLVTATGLGTVVYLRRVAGTIGYELGLDALRIHGSWRPIVIPYRDITGVSIESPPGLPLRVAGISLPGLHWGAYSWKSVGPGLRLYATRLSPLVVVRTGKRRTYGLTPERDAEFVAELRRRIGER